MLITIQYRKTIKQFWLWVHYFLAPTLYLYLHFPFYLYNHCKHILFILLFHNVVATMCTESISFPLKHANLQGINKRDIKDNRCTFGWDKLKRKQQIMLLFSKWLLSIRILILLRIEESCLGYTWNEIF